VASAQVLDEGVTSDHHRSCSVGFEASHRSEPGLESTVVALDPVVGVHLVSLSAQFVVAVDFVPGEQVPSGVLGFEVPMKFAHIVLTAATFVVLLSSCSGSEQEGLTDELDTALERIEQLELSLEEAGSNSGTTSTSAPTSTTAAPTTTTTVPSVEQASAKDCVLETTGGAIAGVDSGTDIVLAVATLVDQCGLPDIDSGWGWSCAMGGPEWDGPQEPERSMIWGNLKLTFWRQPDNIWEPQEFSESPTYSDAGALSSWQFFDWGEERVVLDIQEAGISFGVPLSEIVAAVGVGVPPDDWYAQEWDIFSDFYDDPWDAYVDNVLSVFGLLSFVGGDGVHYSGWVDSASPATFEDALAGADLGGIGAPSFCD